MDWLDVAGADDYEVFRSQEIESGYTSIGTTPSSDFIDNTAIASQGYYYKVVARFADATKGRPSSPVSGILDGTSVPSGVSFSDIDGSSVRVHWTKVAGATKHEIHIGTNLGGPYTKFGETTILSDALISGLTPQTEHYVFIRAVLGGSNYDSDIASVITLTQPAPPEATIKDAQINLSWTPAVGMDSYDLLRSTDGINFSPIVSGHSTSSFLDTTVANGQQYFYRLRVNYAIGSATSISSSGFTPGVTPLSPAELTVVSDGTGTGVRLSWAKVDGAQKYNVYRSTSSGGPFTVPVFSTAANQNVSNSGLTLGTTYFYRITAANGDMESAPSAVVGFRPDLSPSAPVGQIESPTSLTISWSSVPDADEYDLYRSTDKVSFEPIATGLAALDFEDTTIDPTKTYYYYFQPRTIAGHYFSSSQISAPVNISTSPQTPLGFNAELTSLASAQLNWVTTPSIVSYEILRSTTSGGPYSLLATVDVPATSYLDSTLSASQSYFYIIQSVNSSGVRSTASSEIGVRTVNAPTGLVASNVSTGVSLSWNVVAGASLYKVSRSLWSGGPYGSIGTSATNSFEDSDTEPNLTYYYVVKALFADGEASPNSGEDSILRSGVIDLQVPIEMTDVPLGSSDIEDRQFERTLTQLDTNFYDGSLTYELEVLAENQDLSSREIRLQDSSNATVATISIPAGTTQSTRYIQTFTPNVGPDEYFLELEQTSGDSELTIYAAKLLVTQNGATKTRLYYPLLSYSGNVSSEDIDISAISTSSEGFQSFDQAISYSKESSDLKKIIDYNAWELDALVSTSNGATGSIRLYNTTTDTAVIMTDTSFSSSTIQRAQIFIDEGISEFGPSNDGDQYEIQISCDLECSPGEARLHKAGLWVTLENLSEATVIFRNLPETKEISAATDFEYHRVLIDSSLFSNQQTYFEAQAQDDASSSGTIELQSHGSDSGTAGLLTVPGSILNFDSDTKQVLRSGALTITPNDRFVTRGDPTTGDLKVLNTSIVIKVSKP